MKQTKQSGTALEITKGSLYTVPKFTNFGPQTPKIELSFLPTIRFTDDIET